MPKEIDENNPESLRVVDLKAALKKRGLDTNGVKAVLVARLKESVAAEKGDDSQAEHSEKPSPKASPKQSPKASPKKSPAKAKPSPKKSPRAGKKDAKMEDVDLEPKKEKSSDGKEESEVDAEQKKAEEEKKKADEEKAEEKKKAEEEKKKADEENKEDEVVEKDAPKAEGQPSRKRAHPEASESAKRPRVESEKSKVSSPKGGRSAADQIRQTLLQQQRVQNQKEKQADVSRQSTAKSSMPTDGEPSRILYVQNFVRPFTQPQVQDLLGRRAKLVSFWMDRIKSYAYATYESEDDAKIAREDVYGLKWPDHGRELTATFVTHADELAAKEKAEETQQQRPGARPPISPRDPPPQQPRKSLDELFKKTTAKPSIYYLPLSEEQMLAKKVHASMGRRAAQ